jgi:hypothetical protein
MTMHHQNANQTHQARTALFSAEMAPPGYSDPVVEAYKKDVDRTLLRENLKLNVEERFHKFERFMSYLRELKEAGRIARRLR